MDNEFLIMNAINSNQSKTQRDIAKNTGMSLGNVNVLIKKLINKGFLKVERINTKAIRYMLTSEGLKEKVKATYNYIVSSYRYINEISSKIDSIICSKAFIGINEVCLVGEPDEISELIKMRIKHYNISYKHFVITDEVCDFSPDNTVFIAWNPSYIEKLIERNVSFINLLDRL